MFFRRGPQYAAVVSKHECPGSSGADIDTQYADIRLPSTSSASDKTMINKILSNNKKDGAPGSRPAFGR